MRLEKRKNGDYFELHHIVPKSIDHSLDNLKDNPENGALLTAKEHILAHMLLCKITEGQDKISCLRAAWAMCIKNNGGQNKRYPSMGELARARENLSKATKGVLIGIKGAPKWSKCETLEDWKNTLQEYVDDDFSDPKIAQIFNVSSTAVANWRYKLVIPSRTQETKDKNWLYDNYINKQMSCEEIGQILNRTGAAIQYRLRFYNIPIRTSFERQQLAGHKRKK